MNVFTYFFTISIVIILSVINNSYAQLKKVTFTELDSLQAIQEKEVVIFIHTDWCRYCHQMKNTTFQNNEMINTLNNNFYFIDLDAETKEDINYKNYIFRYKPTGTNTGVHELAEQLGTIKGKMNYPTISIINAKNEILFQYGGFMTAKELLVVLEELK